MRRGPAYSTRKTVRQAIWGPRRELALGRLVCLFERGGGDGGVVTEIFDIDGALFS